MEGVLSRQQYISSRIRPAGLFPSRPPNSHQIMPRDSWMPELRVRLEPLDRPRPFRLGGRVEKPTMTTMYLWYHSQELSGLRTPHSKWVASERSLLEAILWYNLPRQPLATWGGAQLCRTASQRLRWSSCGLGLGSRVEAPILKLYEINFASPLGPLGRHALCDQRLASRHWRVCLQGAGRGKLGCFLASWAWQCGLVLQPVLSRHV